MKIQHAEFVISAAAIRQFPNTLLPEVAFAGKSNVGKSSLMNTILGRKGLVKTSATPGKTRQVNFFRINERWHFVDLPGYGFAKAPKETRETWEALVGGYLAQREPLRGVVMIVDIRHTPGELDQHTKQWLEQQDLPFIVVANKADKLSRGQMAAHLRAVEQALELSEPPLAFSAQTGLGKPELWRWIQARLV